MHRADANTATLAHLICRAAGMKDENGRMFTRSDFMQWMDEEGEATVEELAQVIGGKR
jgi:hypothetical protein